MHRTPLYDEHLGLHAKMTEYAGWEMPLLYEGIRHEHQAVRAGAGVFDLSHMGRVEVRGKDRLAFLDRLSVNGIRDLEPGRARYTVFCHDNGGAVDDLVILVEEDRAWAIPNASNREKDVKWMRSHADGFDVTIRDATFELGMIALQGPDSEAILREAGLDALHELGYFHHRRARLFGAPVLLSRTGYTGEDGFEIVVESAKTGDVWRGLLEVTKPVTPKPAGLGARDTLRIEAALALYGSELADDINPVEAGLERLVKFKGRDFIGKDALLRVSKDDSPDARRLAGLTLAGGRIPRHGHEILHEGRAVGIITSGTFSPTLEKSIAMGYVPRGLAAPGTKLSVRVSHEDVAAEVVHLPFYKRRK
jgi:aminomethyltransferase